MLVTRPGAGPVKRAAAGADEANMQPHDRPSAVPAGPAPAEPGDLVPDSHPWRAAIWITLAGIVLEMVGTLWLVPRALSMNGWFVAADAWAPIPAAQYVANGALRTCTRAARTSSPDPCSPILLAPVAWIGSLFDLTQSVPVPLTHPTLWLVYGPSGSGCPSLFLWAVRRLAVQDAACGRGWSRLQLASVLVVLLPSAGMWMHFEEPLAMACAMLALVEIMRGRDAGPRSRSGRRHRLQAVGAARPSDRGHRRPAGPPAARAGVGGPAFRGGLRPPAGDRLAARGAPALLGAHAYPRRRPRGAVGLDGRTRHGGDAVPARSPSAVPCWSPGACGAGPSRRP